jgi:dihydrofolate reductase
MGKVVVVNGISLDGVMQAPARADEDTRDGFKFGGWGIPYSDPVMAQKMAERMARGSSQGALLLGRRTYEDFYSVWPKRKDGNPYTEHLNKVKKYVASRTLREPLPWDNSALLSGDAADAVEALKKQMDLTILGSGELIKSLMQRNLVDEFLLTIAPIVLGSGRRLFPSGVPASLRLIESVTTTKGVIIATYEVTRAGLPSN